MSFSLLEPSQSEISGPSCAPKTVSVCPYIQQDLLGSEALLGEALLPLLQGCWAACAPRFLFSSLPGGCHFTRAQIHLQCVVIPLILLSLPVLLLCSLLHSELCFSCLLWPYLPYWVCSKKQAYCAYSLKLPGGSFIVPSLDPGPGGAIWS